MLLPFSSSTLLPRGLMHRDKEKKRKKDEKREVRNNLLECVDNTEDRY